jgi:hypothetical protein
MSRRLIACCFVVALASACSSSTHAASKPASSTSPPRASTTAPDLSEVATICQQSNARLGDAARQAFGSGRPSADEWRPFMLQTVLPIIEQRLDAMSRTTAAQSSSIAEAVATGRAAVVSAQNNPAQLDPATRAPFDRYDDLVDAAGLRDCAVGG